MLRIVPWRAPAPAGSTTWRTVNGDVLDDICQRHYGRTDVVGAVLDANPGLAALPPILPAGVTIVLPPPPDPPPQVRAFRLWDLP